MRVLLSVVICVLALCADVSFGADKYDNELMRVYVHDGDIEQVKHLIDSGADVNAKIDGVTAIEEAGSVSNKEMVRFLMSEGAKPSLCAAAGAGDNELVLKLIHRGHSVKEASGTYGTPLHWAAHNGHADTVTLLLSKGADPKAMGEFGTPLHCAASRHFQAAAECLLAAGVNVDIRDSEGQTPLHKAVLGKGPDMALHLLGHGADINARDHSGCTPLWCACAGLGFDHRVDVIACLLDRGADPNISCYTGASPLRLVALQGEDGIARLLISRGAKEDLFSAAQLGHSGEVARLIASKANVNEAAGAWQYTPLHLAAAAGHLDIVDLLVSHGAKIDAQSKDRYTPLMLAAAKGHIGVVRYLVAHGADRNITDLYGRTALCLAEEAKQGTTAVYLRNPTIVSAGFSSAVILVVILLSYGAWRFVSRRWTGGKIRQ